ncbi:hypothetical protein ES703_111401 [subsurface metagenome]
MELVIFFTHFNDFVKAHQNRVIVIPYPLGIPVNHLLQQRQLILKRRVLLTFTIFVWSQKLIDLLLIMGYHELGIRMLDEVFDLIGHTVGKNASCDSASRLSSQFCPVPLWFIVTQNRYLIPPLQAQAY